MYFRILKKDLKRKKTMNVIILLFVILATMFISSSVSNLVTVTTALDDFFEMSGMSDYYAGTVSDGTDYADMSPIIDALTHVTDYKTENSFAITKEEQLQINNHSVTLPVAMLVTSFDTRMYNYYKADNTALQQVNPGEVYFCISSAKNWDLCVGDRVTMDIAGIKKEMKVAGFFKDAMFNSEFVGNKRILLSQEDFDMFYQAPAIIPYTTVLANINTDDVQALHTEFGNLDASFRVNYNLPESLLKNAYIMDVLVMAILMVFSIFIVLIALTILRFSVHFSIEEEFREIGVMKAIGLPQSRTRWIYVTKYAGIALVGAFIGFLLSIPFGKMLIRNAEDSIVITGDGSILLSVLSAGAVALIIVLFSYHCTGKMKRYTPMDAIRSGETGERYSKKGKLSLAKTRLSNPLFLAVNDLHSNPRRYLVMLIAFSLSLILICMLADTANTLQSDKMIRMLGMQESDAVISTDIIDINKMLTEDGDRYLNDRLVEIEENLRENGIPAKVFCEVWVHVTIKKGDAALSSNALLGMRTKTEDYSYLEGSAPQSSNEIALTAVNAERLGVGVGDTVICDGKNCIVSGLFDCFNNMGDTARLHPDYSKDFREAVGSLGIQVKFTEEIDSTTEDSYRDQLSALYPEADIMDTEAFMRKSMGSSGNMVEQLKNLAVMIVLLVSILTVVLMERSFISKEKNEIALLKAMGFRNRTLALWHSLRILLLIVLAAIISLALSYPLTKLCITPIFAMMGATQIEFVINPMEDYLVYPVIMIVFTVAATWLTAQFMTGISAADTSNIE